MEQHKQLIRNFMEQVWHQRQLDQMPAYWQAGFINHALPPSMQQGMDNLTISHQLFLSAFSELTVEVLDQLAEADKVATRLVLKGKHTGDFMGLPATNKTFAMTGIRIDRIENNKIAEHWANFDLAGLMQQLK